MNETMLQAQIDAANAYEALFVPALFGQWAPKVADAARIQPDERVLDVACGTGILAREIMARIGAGGHVAGVDPSAGMIAVAGRMTPRIEWRVGVAESLPFPDGSFDVVVSQFGLMFFEDRHRALREMARVLVAGGRLSVAVFDNLESMPAYAAEVALLERMAGAPAANVLRAPFVLGDRDELAGLFPQAGFAAVDVATRTGTARFPSIRAMVEADLRGWLPVMGVVLREEQIGHVLDGAEQALSAYATHLGQAEFRVSAHLVTAVKAGEGGAEVRNP